MIDVFEQFSTTFKTVMQSLPTCVLSCTRPTQIGALLTCYAPFWPDWLPASTSPALMKYSRLPITCTVIHLVRSHNQGPRP